MCFRVLLLLFASGCSLVIRAEQVLATVFDSGSGHPIAGVTLSLSNDGIPVAKAETDQSGRAAFREVRPGVYLLNVEALGYVDLLDALRRGRQIEVARAQKTEIRLDLAQEAAISGQVLDSQGRPLEGAQAVPIVRRGSSGDSRFTTFGRGSRTDDRGSYRLHGLPPGHYSVAVVPTEDMSGFLPVYFPGTGDPDRAVFFAVQPAETRSSVNLTVNLPDPEAGTVSVSGRVLGIPADASPARVHILLSARGALRFPITDALGNAGGSFAFQNLRPGDYQLTAQLPGSEPRSAAEPVSVAAGDVNADLVLKPLVSLTGRLVWDGSPESSYPCSGAQQIDFHPEDVWLDDPSLAVAVNGDRISVEKLPAGRYKVEMPGLEQTCRLAEVRVGDEPAQGGHALIDGTAPLTVVLTTATGKVSGTVTTEDGKPAAGTVLLVSADSNQPVQTAPIDTEGRYQFSRVLTGAYRLMTLARLTSTDYLDPLEAANLGAKSITVEAGQKVTSDLKLVRQ